jgi:hypothetical protein
MHKDGSLTDARFRDPRGIAVVDGLIYVADGTCIRIIDLTKNTVSTFAGSGSSAGNVNGSGTSARFGQLSGLTSDGKNKLYVTDIYYNLVKQVSIDNLAPAANFTATKVSLLVNEETTLTDASTGKAATSRKWTVTNASNTTTNVTLVNGDFNASASVTVKFTATGFYNAKLEVTNEFGTDSKTTNSFFNVSTTGSISAIHPVNGLLVYPNPSKNEVFVNGAAFDLQQAEIYVQDISGKNLMHSKGLNGLTRLDISSLNAGIYTLRLVQDGKMYYQKIQVH